MIRRLGITALVSLALGACADLTLLERIAAPVETGAPAPAEQEPTRPSLSDMGIWGQAHDFWIAPPPGAATPPPPRRKPDRAEPSVAAKPGPDPDLLVGLDFEATKALLGIPALKMEQPPAKVWAYNGGSCMFSVFFYPSMDDNVFRVLTYEVTGTEPELPLQTASGTSDTGVVKIRDRASPTLRRCFADLLHERDEPDAG